MPPPMYTCHQVLLLVHAVFHQEGHYPLFAISVRQEGYINRSAKLKSREFVILFTPSCIRNKKSSFLLVVATIRGQRLFQGDIYSKKCALNLMIYGLFGKIYTSI